MLGCVELNGFRLAHPIYFLFICFIFLTFGFYSYYVLSMELIIIESIAATRLARAAVRYFCRPTSSNMNLFFKASDACNRLGVSQDMIAATVARVRHSGF